MLKKNQNSHTFISMGEGISPEIFQNIIVCEWLNSTQAARYLGITENALRIMVHRRQIKFHKVGRRLRFHREDIFDLLPGKVVESDKNLHR